MTYYEAMEKHLKALDAHDRETRRLHEVAMTTQEYPPAGTFPAREEARRLLSIKLEEAARGVLASHLGISVIP